MKLKEITFHYFRSFGKKQASIDFDENITSFVGKNHTGKTNLMKFLEDIKRHNLPFNEKYVLERSNWYNNESGIERPLKFRITASINNKEYRLMTEKMFLEPILNYFKELSLLGDYDIKSESKAKLKNLLTFKNCKNIFY